MGAWGSGVFENDQTLDAIADLREAGDPVGHLEQKFATFLAATSTGYDRSEFAEAWAGACAALGLCEVLRLAVAHGRGSSTPDLVPHKLSLWIRQGAFAPDRKLLLLAVEVCDRVADSAWMESDWPEYRTQTLIPLREQLIALTD